MIPKQTMLKSIKITQGSIFKPSLLNILVYIGMQMLAGIKGFAIVFSFNLKMTSNLLKLILVVQKFSSKLMKRSRYHTFREI